MLRTIIGYAILAVVGFFALKLVLGLLGVAMALAFNLLWLAALGFGVYMVLKVISPDTARKIHDMIAGRPRIAP
ncbi:MAG TPA: hypothetical protein VGI83_02795 [Gemmatimonadales bacterium]|jgi:hypothetical protein